MPREGPFDVGFSWFTDVSKTRGARGAFQKPASGEFLGGRIDLGFQAC